MIERKIHYCWFGGNPLPEDSKRYIESWKKYCPDFEIIEWNENNFDINCNTYVKEAYEAKKWAFITDYVRLYVLYNYGGIYMDTDVEVLKPLDEFLIYDGFSGFESNKTIPTGIMASKKGNKFIYELLQYYNEKHFRNDDGSLDLTTNVITITNIANKFGFIPNGKKQTILDYTFFPSDYFCPKNSTTLEINLTKNSHTIHHFASSWIPKKNKLKNKIKKLLGPKIMKFLVKFLKKD